jgi:hypothetical protein
VHEQTVAQSSASNGIAERMNRTLFDITGSLIIDCTVLMPFWSDAISTTCHIRNCLPSESINNVSPHQLWFGNAPTFKAFRRFSCIAYAHTLSIPRGAKVNPRGIHCCFLGYVNISQGIFLLWDLQHGRQIQSRDVRLIEGQSPTHEEFVSLPNCLAQLVIPAPDDPEIHMDPISIDDDQDDALSNNMEFDNVLLLAPIDDPATSSSTIITDPANIEDALSRWDYTRWKQACYEELTKMHQYGTWTVVRRPKDINIVDTKWVLYIKNPGTKEE